MRALARAEAAEASMANEVAKAREEAAKAIQVATQQAEAAAACRPLGGALDA